ncbi:MAG: hypothetical protein LBU62_03285 [Bacteroidales bacterium]|nr:hypothetical protein [Bacteroidales bacterium]
MNVSRFAAYKAKKVTDIIAAQANLPTEEYKARANRILDLMKARGQTEYNTTVTRTRSAKDWEKFEGRKSLFPNIKWLPSASIHKREEHRHYYNRVWSKDDPFWNNNQPGTLWNCKCDWRETDEPVNATSVDVPAAKGLKGNPAKTGKIFSNDASYFYDPAGKTFEQVSKLYYTDSQSNLKINVCAHHEEISDNVRTGRILLDNYPGMDLEIRKHVGDQSNGVVKNPEYLLNGKLADAKRLNSWNGVSSGFNSAVKQKCEAVIIDLHNLQNEYLDIEKIAKGIVNRYVDFKNKTILECYVIWKGKSVMIHGSLFNSYNPEKKNNYKIQLEKILSKLL